MSKIIISINPIHVENIINGTKKYEYRTKVAQKHVDSLIIYCTYPTKKVLAEVKIKSVLSFSPEELWQKTKDYSGISKEFYDKYFSGRKVAHAYELGDVLEYDEPKELEEFGFHNAPQSFAYV